MPNELHEILTQAVELVKKKKGNVVLLLRSADNSQQKTANKHQSKKTGNLKDPNPWLSSELNQPLSSG